MPARRPLLAVAAAASVLCGCDEYLNDVHRCYATDPTVAEGLYGCAATDDSFRNRDALPIPGFVVNVYEHDPFRTDIEPTLLGSAVTDELGFYELAVPAGYGWVCSARWKCMMGAVASGEPTRFHYSNTYPLGWFPVE